MYVSLAGRRLKAVGVAELTYPEFEHSVFLSRVSYLGLLFSGGTSRKFNTAKTH
jgi:hypothetical protein